MLSRIFKVLFFFFLLATPVFADSTLSYQDWRLDPYYDWYSETELPFPSGFNTTEAMESGSWGDRIGTRAALSETGNPYESPYEWDFGTVSVNSLTIVDIYGATICTPQLAESGTASVTVALKIEAKRTTDPGSVAVNVGVSLYKWKADNTLGTVYANALYSSALTTSYVNKNIGTPVAAGVSFAAGDRLCSDFWLRVNNSSGSNYNGKWGYVKFGDGSFNGHLHTTVAVNQLQGIMTPNGMVWGDL